MNIPPLGVGLVYIPGLEPLFESSDNPIQVLELEPQTLWRYFPGRSQPYANNRELLNRLSQFPQRKIVHGVGFPVGGTQIPDPRHLPPLLEAITTIDAAWCSEHLVFNLARDSDGELFQTGFFLPPLATPAGVERAVSAIRSQTGSLPVPFAVETPANYLQPIAGEMRDGEFTAAVVEQADCGILLDLHNIWTNEQNGRQAVDAFLDDIPLDRVVEIHLAGGLRYGRYWLDAHSGAVPQEVLDWTRRIVPYLPNLGAIVYELLPAYLPQFGLDGVRQVVDEMNELWSLRKTSPQLALPLAATIDPATSDGSETTLLSSPHEWEDTLADLVVSQRAPDTPLARLLANDPALPMVKSLNRKFRLSAVVANLRLSIRLLLLTLGQEAFDRLVADYCLAAKPNRFAIAEATGFADYVNGLELEIPHLDELLTYEVTAMNVIADGKARIVYFSVDPNLLLKALAQGELLTDPAMGNTYEAEIVPPEDGYFLTQPTLH